MSSISSLPTRLAVSSSTRHPRWEHCLSGPRVRLLCWCSCSGLCLCLCLCLCLQGDAASRVSRVGATRTEEHQAASRRAALALALALTSGGGGRRSKAVRRPKPATDQPQLVGLEMRNNGPVVTTSAGFTSLGTGATSMRESSAGGGAETATVTASGDGQAREGHPSREASNSSCQPGSWQPGRGG